MVLFYKVHSSTVNNFINYNHTNRIDVNSCDQLIQRQNEALKKTKYGFFPVTQIKYLSNNSIMPLLQSFFLL